LQGENFEDADEVWLREKGKAAKAGITFLPAQRLPQPVSSQQSCTNYRFYYACHAKQERKVSTYKH
jgi:hypothetical protein